MGNICRSPTAEGVFRHFVQEAGLADRIKIDSAGTHAYHMGEPADRRASAAAERRGYSLADIRARRVQAEDFENFNYIVAMDRLNHVTLIDRADAEHHDKIRLFLEFSSTEEDEVPDPYYGGAAGFDRVLDLVEEASRGLLETLADR
ncbi:MAG: low molecular weight phosphotyrosine protein phosphatase [Proteobacteria bacterium]|nr:low molecular weight phosphotyrosine protein phosphatase [Pseudomonadota bacterium]